MKITGTLMSVLNSGTETTASNNDGDKDSKNTLYSTMY